MPCVTGASAGPGGEGPGGRGGGRGTVLFAGSKRDQVQTGSGWKPNCQLRSLMEPDASMATDVFALQERERQAERGMCVIFMYVCIYIYNMHVLCATRGGKRYVCTLHIGMHTHT